MYANLWIQHSPKTRSAIVTRDGRQLGTLQRGQYKNDPWTATNKKGVVIGEYTTALEGAWALAGGK